MFRVSFNVQNTNSQYNLAPLPGKIAYKKNRADVSERFADPAARKSVDLDLALMDTYDNLLREVESHIRDHARAHDHDALRRLQTIPGVGKILAVLAHKIGRATYFILKRRTDFDMTKFING